MRLNIPSILVVFFLVLSTHADAKATKKKKSNKESLDDGKDLMDAFNNAADLLEDAEANIGSALEIIGTIMEGFGPKMAALGIVFQFVNIFLPKGESEELTYMKEQFAKVEAKLDGVASKMDDIQFEAVYQGTKMSFGPYIRKVKALNRHLRAVLKSPNKGAQKINMMIFEKSYYQMYEDSAMTLFNALMGKESQYFGYDLLQVITKKVNCNVKKIFDFCVLNSKIIGDAIGIEGAFLGMRQKSDRAEQESQEWKARMKQLSSRCTNFIRQCQKNWRAYADKMINQIYNLNVGKDNQQLANLLFTKLSQNIPDRAWAVWVYNDAWGFGPHTVSYSKSQIWMLWHKHGKCVTIDSVSSKYKFNANEAKSALQKARSDILACRHTKSGDPAKRIVERINPYMRWRGGAYYAIQDDIGLAYQITKDRHSELHIAGKRFCNRYRHKAFIFQ